MDYLFEGAVVYTLDRNEAKGEALAVKDGLVAAVGDRAALRDRFPRAKRIDLGGAFVAPAFNDCHGHLIALGLDLGRPGLRDCCTVDEIVDTLEKWSQDNPQAGWVIGRDYDQNILPGRKHITRQALDRTGNGRPVVIYHTSRHAMAVNSKALELAGITADTPNPDGGAIVRDESGAATGLLLEAAMDLCSRVIPAPDKATLTKACLDMSDHLAKRGVLAASDAYTGGSLDMDLEWPAYTTAIEQGGRVRLTLMPEVEAAWARGWQNKATADLPPLPANLRLGAIKILGDGALTSRTAAMREPFEDTGDRGMLIFEREVMIDHIVTAHRGGWQVAVHAIGDRCIDICLEGFEKAQGLAPRTDCRHRIEHCMIMDQDQIKRMAELKVIACAQPEFIYWLGHAYRAGLQKRADFLMPYRAWAKAGVEMSFGSDQPVVPGDPIIGWRCAVDRTARAGDVLGTDQCLDPIEALKIFTAGSARATFDTEIGTLEPGKQARFMVLNLPPEEILNPEMKVTATAWDFMDL